MNPALLHYQYTRPRHRRLQKRREAEAAAVAVAKSTSEVLTESDQATGFWIIPGGQGKITKLKISESYKVRGRQYPVASGTELYPAWAIVANYNLLRKHIGWMESVVSGLAKSLMSVPFSDSWMIAMSSLSEALLRRGWCYYMHRPHPTFACSAKSQALEVFGAEFFRGVVQKPEALTFDYESVASVMVVTNGSEQSMTRDKFAKLLRADSKSVAATKKKYDSLLALLEDVMANRVDWPNVDFVRIQDLLKPAVVNITVASNSEIAVEAANLVSWWFEANKRKGRRLPYHYKEYSAAIQRIWKQQKDAGQQKPKSGKVPLTEPKLRRNGPDGMRPPQPALAEALPKGLTEAIGRQILTEGKSFSNLLANTRNHGRYRVGGLVRIDGRWVNDILVPGRMENARFVIGSPPLTHIEPDGSVIYRWKFKSKHNRSTTGMTHLGYLRVMPKKKGIMNFLKRLIKGTGPWEGDCQVWCSCQDFRYRFHYANWEADASHKPTGNNGDATLEPPRITNPRHIPMICKHLIFAGTVFLHDPPKKLRNEVAELQDLARERSKDADYQPPEPQEDTPSAVGGNIAPTTRVGGTPAPAPAPVPPTP